MGVSYATRSDVMGINVPRGALVRPSREVARADATADVLELEGHGLAADDALSFQVDAGGVLPAPLAIGTTYYAKALDEDHFQVAATPGGPAIDLTNVGTAPFSLVVPIGPMIDTFLEEFSRWADGKLVAHIVPLTAPFPTWVTRIVALRTVVAVLQALGRSIPKLEEREQTAILDFITQGKVPLRDSRATPSANTAIARSAADAAGAAKGTIP